MKLIVFLLLILTFLSVGHAYTFTSSEGAKFDGIVLRVQSDSVTVKRTSDNKEFTLKKSRFSADDQKYFEVWEREISNVPKGRRLKEIITDKYLGQE
ncbi:MAG TPA: hypothetical protein DIU37_05420, partial [Opitutae bacterium]|nr:hypothetical protein [Opitutae bacterium]